jgi:hypothetical protein
VHLFDVAGRVVDHLILGHIAGPVIDTVVRRRRDEQVVDVADDLSAVELRGHV